MAYPYIVQSDLEDRVSATVLRRILDDDNAGSAKPSAVTRVIADASAKVAGYLRGIYDLDVVAANPPQEVVRLTLDVATAYLFQRFPEYARGDWLALMQQCDVELKALRRGDTRLDVTGPPEPAANTGGDVSQGNPDTFDPSSFTPTFAWGSGDY